MWEKSAYGISDAINLGEAGNKKTSAFRVERLEEKAAGGRGDFFLFAAIFVLGFFMGIASGGELVMLLIFVTGLTVAGVVTRKRKGINKEFMENMQQDFFQVMDCKAFDADPNTDIIGCGTVKIYNEQGQYCRDFFAVDKEAVKEYVRGEEPSFLLMKCVCTEKKPEEFYRLFSQKGLRGR